MKGIGAAVLLAVVASACGRSDSDAMVNVGESDSGRAVVLRAEQELVVTLSSNPSTGYGWACAATPQGVLLAGPTQYIATRPVKPGSGGYERMTFGAIGAGSTVLACEYRRGW